ncbi:MAG: OmpA family protein [Saprospiraceae bacterium]
MKINYFICLLIMVFGLGSCVSSKKYKNLQEELTNAQAMLDAQKKKSTDCESSKMDLEKMIAKLKYDIDQTKGETGKLQNQVSELEKMKSLKEQELMRLKEEIKKAFSSINTLGLTITQSGDKLYVSLPDQVLYKKGSASISANGTKVLKSLGSVFAANPNMSITVEGHTDKSLVKDGAKYKDNLELSTVRANNAVRMLLTQKVKPEQLTSAGRSSFEPTGKMMEGRDKNALDRRLEFIITPDVTKLYELSKKS